MQVVFRYYIYIINLRFRFIKVSSVSCKDLNEDQKNMFRSLTNLLCRPLPNAKINTNFNKYDTFFIKNLLKPLILTIINICKCDEKGVILHQ